MIRGHSGLFATLTEVKKNPQCIHCIRPGQTRRAAPVFYLSTMDLWKVFLVLGLFIPGAVPIFRQVEVDYLNDTVTLSPIQVMIVSLFLLFIAVLNWYGYLPIALTPILSPYASPTSIPYPLGRSNLAVGLNQGSPISQVIPMSSVKYYWDMSIAFATMDPKVCFQEFVCEINRAREKWHALKNTLEAEEQEDGKKSECKTLYQCPFGFDKIAHQIFGLRIPTS
ncbi:unnamed protein product [Darwinula stevensoni]|uniref:Uncharacterized protein n=1 Tax=Darwinula stevensoni TaxID=69355 RepID=A0A7R8XFZ9_9CRUS|nr:unnamed protein product [Darwinula stevensoni]CAG0889272.1 unnamed protein product [Darwinula stevensoni]